MKGIPHPPTPREGGNSGGFHGIIFMGEDLAGVKYHDPPPDLIDWPPLALHKKRKDVGKCIVLLNRIRD